LHSDRQYSSLPVETVIIEDITGFNSFIASHFIALIGDQYQRQTILTAISDTTTPVLTDTTTARQTQAYQHQWCWLQTQQ
jgi:hypothetical protein